MFRLELKAITRLYKNIYLKSLAQNTIKFKWSRYKNLRILYVLKAELGIYEKI